MIIAVAGRRVDAPDAEAARFPVANVPVVRERLAELFASSGATQLVASAACGADLLALEVAGELGLARHVVLPFPREEFREVSVTDRPGAWGPLYDAICDQAEAEGRLRILAPSATPQEGYERATVKILELAVFLAESERGQVLAVQVWDGISRGPDDLTALFGEHAREHGIPVTEVATL